MATEATETNPDVAIALKQIKSRASEAQYGLYRDYYAGKQRLSFATTKFRETFAGLFQAFADNLCPLVVESVADRLNVTGFGIETGAQSLSNDAWEIWQSNRMDEQAARLHSHALRYGDAYVVVWPADDGVPVLWVQDCPELITVTYDEERPNVLLWAAKAWVANKKARLNLYYPDRIEKYVAPASGDALPENGKSFGPLEVPGEPWPVPNPWDVVPVFHFANNAWRGRFGESELCPVVPLQDALNKSVCDMLVAMEFAAFPQRWATGLEVETDPDTGQPKPPFKAGVDRVWAVANELVKFGQFEPGNLENFLKVQQDLRAEIARVTGLPPHYVQPQTGNHPSGEALKTAEARLVKKAKKRQTSFGNVWEDALELALRMKSVPTPVKGSSTRLTAQWADAADVSEKELAETLVLKKSFGVSDQQLLMEAGYGDEDIKRMMAEKQEAAQQAAEQQAKVFDAGGLPLL